MMIHKFTPSVNYNKWLKRLDTQLNETTNQNSINLPKVGNQRIRNVIIKLWGLIKSLHSCFFNLSILTPKSLYKEPFLKFLTKIPQIPSFTLQ